MVYQHATWELYKSRASSQLVTISPEEKILLKKMSFDLEHLLRETLGPLDDHEHPMDTPPPPPPLQPSELGGDFSTTSTSMAAGPRLLGSDSSTTSTSMCAGTEKEYSPPETSTGDYQLCPIPGCGRRVKRLWNHLNQFHKKKRGPYSSATEKVMVSRRGARPARGVCLGTWCTCSINKSMPGHYRPASRTVPEQNKGGHTRQI